MSTADLAIMLVDDNAERAGALREVLTAHGYRVVACVSAMEYLPNRIREAQPDVILIDIDAPSRDALEQISSVNRQMPRPIVMLSRDEDAATIQAAISAGVSAYLVDGLKATRFRPVIDMAIAHFREYQALRDELEKKTRTSLTERKLIDRAKGLLMEQRGITEPQAYAILRKLAMNRKRRIADVAADVIDMAEMITHEPPSQ